MAADTIPSVLERAARDHPDVPALVEGTTALTYAELLDACGSVAAAVTARGVRSHQRVGIWAHNSIDWAVVCFGALMAGASVVPINTRYTPAEAADIVQRASCRLVFASSQGFGRNLASECAGFIDDARVVDIGQLASFSAEAGSEPDRATLPSGDDPAFVQYTSGTTGRPKGALLRHSALVRTTEDWVRVVGLAPGDTYPIVSPFSHIGGHKTGLLACVTAAATALPQASLDVDRLLRLVEEHRVALLQGAPTMFAALIAAVRRGEGSVASVRAAVTGAAVIPPSLIREMRSVLGIPAVFAGYGLTEAAGVVSITAGDDHEDIVATTCGRPIPGVEVRIVDADGGECAIGEQGEVTVRGHNVMIGYLDDPEATADAVRDGWLHTGDVGVLDDSGRLSIVDRLTDMIVTGGFNVYPAEVEAALASHADVAQAAVAGRPDERLGEVPVAFVVAVAGADMSTERLDAHCREVLAGFKCPRSITVVEALPTNAAGKVLRREL